MVAEVPAAGAYEKQRRYAPAVEEARALARLAERQLGYTEGHIDSVALRLFIRAYWTRISRLAHAIHQADE